MVDIRTLRGVNLNRLPVLWELLRCRNVSLAADNLGLTQSTVSAALKALRELFDDELLVPSGRELVLTERAQELLPMLEATLNLVQDLVSEPDFDPKVDESVFRISTADYVSTLLLPHVMEALAAQAPRMALHMLPANKSAIRDVQQGIIDLIIGPEQMLDWIDAQPHADDFCFEKCFEDSLVYVARRGSAPLSTPEDYLDAPHAAIQLQRGLPASIEHDFLITRRLRQFNRLLVPEFWLLPFIVARSGTVALVPRSMTPIFTEMFELQVFEPPLAFPPLRLCLLWRRGREREGHFRWFLDQVRAAFAAQQAGPFIPGAGLDDGATPLRAAPHGKGF